MQALVETIQRLDLHVQILQHKQHTRTCLSRVSIYSFNVGVNKIHTYLIYHNHHMEWKGI